VQASVRAPLVSSDVTREVQPPSVGLPDPAVLAAPPRKKVRDEDPYGQIGFRAGGLNLYPSIEQAIGYDSNPNRVSGPKKGSLVHRTEGELRVQSDWSRHELTGLLRGAYSVFPDVQGADRPDGSGRLNLRIDASRDSQIDLETRYVIDTQRPGSPDLNASARSRPLVSTGGASAGFTQRFNRLSLGLRGSIDRAVYEDARLTNGTILDQSDRDLNQYGLRLRAGYELTPGVTPFVEALGDTRVYDRKTDAAGFRRDSEGIGARAGSTFEITRTLTGEASAGYQTRKYDDPRLKDLRGPLVDAALVWSATPLTTVRLRSTTEMGETTIADASGALVHRATAEVQHDLRRNLSLIGSATVWEADYRGANQKEEGFAGSVRLDYKLTRSIALRASYTHERLNSSSPGSDYTADVYLLGLKFQP
jgi:hypothetical protein